MAKVNKIGVNNFDIDHIKMEDIVVINATIDNQTKLNSLPHKGYLYIIKLNLDASVSLDYKKIKIILETDVQIVPKGNQDSVQIKAKFEISYIYDVSYFGKKTVQGDSDDSLNDSLLLNLIAIAYATSRGIIYTRCQGTILNRIFLPILSNAKLQSVILESNAIEVD